MRALLALCRPYYAGPIALGFLLTVFYARGGDMTGQWPSVWLATAALALTIMSGHVLNDVFDRVVAGVNLTIRSGHVLTDVFDRVVDGVNAPTRPMPAGRVRPGAAVAFGAALVAAGLALAWAFCRPFAAVLSAVAAMLLFYNATSKRLGLAKPVVVALLMTSIYPLAFAQAGG
ncbi:MAG: UbiA family prenyltransferase, partial [Planctomycetota bacterium]|nr:UbiA family prenyltransferase [Planctomycetota bacterium]